MILGKLLGFEDGLKVGSDPLGEADGFELGDSEGCELGCNEGNELGLEDGLAEGD